MIKKPLREIMLDVHEERLKELYELPAKSSLAYNCSSTQICVDGRPLYDHLSDRLSEPEFLDRLMTERTKRKKRIIEAHNNWKQTDSRELFNLQFDYEMLALDHLVDSNQVTSLADTINCDFKRKIAINTLLTPSSGKTFFEEVHIKELETLGDILRKSSPLTNESFFFEDKNFDYLVKHTLTRNKLINIVLEHDRVVSELRARYEQLPKLYPGSSSPNEIYSQIKEMRIEQMRRRAATRSVLEEFEGESRKYLEFVGDALDYNEDNRLLRSVTFYHVMKDKSIPKRFYKLIEERKNGV